MCQTAGGFKYCFLLQAPKDKMLCPVCERFCLKKNALSWISASSSFFAQTNETVLLWRGELGGAFPPQCTLCFLSADFYF